MSEATENRPLLHRNPSRSRSARRTRLPLPPTRSSPPSSMFRFGSHRRHVHKTRAASVLILLSLVFERIAFYGLAGNLVLFLNQRPLNWESYHAVNASLYFFGVCFVMSLIGGWLADAIFGRFKALLISFVIYMGGYALMPLVTPHNLDMTEKENLTLPSICGNKTSSAGAAWFDERCSALIYIALTIIAIGTGFVKANIAPFGSDQVVKEGQHETLSFFNWFYWSINLGAAVGLSVVTYVQQAYSFYLGYLLSVSCLGLSALLFLAGRCFYHVRPPDGSVLSNIVRIIREAYFRRRLQRQTRALSRGHQNRGKEVDEANSVEPEISFLDYAKHRYGGIFHDGLVDDVKRLKKIFAVFAVLILYWLVYFQMQTTFLLQGLHMRLMIHMNKSSHAKGKAQIVAAWFSLFDVMTLILLLPLFDRVIYPWLERRSGIPVGISRRMALGMVFGVLAMLTAGVVENFRLQAYWPNASDPCVDSPIKQYIGDTVYYAADLSILYQIPQYALIGLSEVFTSVAGLQFAVSVAPRSMKGIIMGLFYLFSGIGSFLGTGIVTVLSSFRIWFRPTDHGDINCRFPCHNNKTFHSSKSCHLDYYFFLLAGIQLLGLLLFLLVARVFHLDEHQRHSQVAHQLADASGDFMDPVEVRHRNRCGSPHSIQEHSEIGIS